MAGGRGKKGLQGGPQCSSEDTKKEHWLGKRETQVERGVGEGQRMNWGEN